MSSSPKAKEAVNPDKMSSMLRPAKFLSARPEIISVCTGTDFSVCSVPVAVTTTSSSAMFFIASLGRLIVESCAETACATQSKAVARAIRPTTLQRGADVM